ncbi:MAG: hypothetical protein KGH60_01200 [Candidatus Micrarchaeota archaeon]|nr:hypothetical protein [Candidatus Micrarchaeota archaeon]
MPYITFSRKIEHNSSTSKASSRISSLFENSIVERRGSKSVKKIIQSAHSKGFSKVIILSESKIPKELSISLLDSTIAQKRFAWKGEYKIRLAGKGKITTDDGIEATEEFTKNARE